MIVRHMAGSAVVLTLFAVVGTAMVSFTFDGTREQIAENERQALLQSLYTLVPADAMDNDIFNDTIQVSDAVLLGTPEPITIYRARKAGEPVAVVLSPIAPDGYSGALKLLVGIRLNGELAGVRVVAHKETPGLGDAVEEKKSPWILGFAGRSLDNPTTDQWRVKKDGGVFDQFTGATITPRAVVKAVFNSLQFYQKNRDKLFAVARPKEKASG